MNPVQVVLKGLFIIGVLLLTLFGLKYSVIEQLAASESVYLDATSALQVNPEVLARMAHREQVSGNLEKALILYQQSLKNFVLHAPSWLGMAEVFFDQGKKNQAVTALKTLDNLKLHDVDLLWRKAKIAQKIGRKDILLSTLVQLAENDKINNRKIFDLAGETWDDPHFLLKNFKPSYYPDILLFYIRKNKVDNAKTVWQATTAAGSAKTETAVAYVAFLLENNEFDPAINVWRKTFQTDGHLLYNGNFKNHILDSDFGWRSSDTNTVSLQYNDILGGLTIRFAGTENEAYMLSQVVPLYPGKHIFRGTFETTNLTSEQRPYWLITGYNCKGLYLRDKMLPPSEYETEFAIPFAVPASCKAVKISLIRNRANDYDSLISGSVTLKKLKISRLSPPPEIPEEAEVQPVRTAPLIEPSQEPETAPDEIQKTVKPQEVPYGKSKTENRVAKKTEITAKVIHKKELPGTQETEKPTTIHINRIIIRP